MNIWIVWVFYKNEGKMENQVTILVMRNLKNIIHRHETFGEDICRKFFLLIDHSLPLFKKVKPRWRWCFRRQNVKEAFLLLRHAHPPLHGHHSVRYGTAPDSHWVCLFLLFGFVHVCRNILCTCRTAYNLKILITYSGCENRVRWG